MTRISMMHEVMKRYGMKSKITFWFCNIAKNNNMSMFYITEVYNKVMNGDN